MVTPLHLQIAIHYRCRVDQFEMVLTNDTRRDYAEDLVQAGLLKEIRSETGCLEGFAQTDGLAVWVNALCTTPFPVKRWVMPDPAGRAALAREETP